jgi:hypothetical protein
LPKGSAAVEIAANPIQEVRPGEGPVWYVHNAAGVRGPLREHMRRELGT